MTWKISSDKTEGSIKSGALCNWIYHPFGSRGLWGSTKVFCGFTWLSLTATGEWEDKASRLQLIQNFYHICFVFLLMSMDWFKGKFTGKPHTEWENLWFPVDFSQQTNPVIVVNTHQLLLGPSSHVTPQTCQGWESVRREVSWLPGASGIQEGEWLYENIW